MSVATRACDCAISQTLTDAEEIRESINDIVGLYFGDLAEGGDRTDAATT